MIKILNLKEAPETVGSHWFLLFCIDLGDNSEKAAGIAICSWNSFWIEGGGNTVLSVPYLSYGIIY